MNDHIFASKLKIEKAKDPSEIGYELNETPMSALIAEDGRNYAHPREVFLNLAARMQNE